jgi:heme/copper-type cytochrome/quinol oxidase subunit 1
MTVIATMIALGFHAVLLDMVSGITGSQWAAQVGESIELTLTYGLVISALLFLGVMALLRYIVPWQRVWGLVETSFTRSE